MVPVADELDTPKNPPPMATPSLTILNINVWNIFTDVRSVSSFNLNNFLLIPIIYE